MGNENKEYIFTLSSHGISNFVSIFGVWISLKILHVNDCLFPFKCLIILRI